MHKLDNVKTKTRVSLLWLVLLLVSLSASSLLIASPVTASAASETEGNDDSSPAKSYSRWLAENQFGAEDGLGGWSSWGHDLLNSRFQPFAGQLKASNVNGLQLKWAFVFPGTTSASSQPIVVGDTLYVGSWNAHFYALSARTGQLKWDYDTTRFTGPLPTGVTNAVRDGAAIDAQRVYFGDTLGNLYALNARTGQPVWVKKDTSHPTARITAAPVVWGGRVYIGISSLESSYALDPTYPCCTFRGSEVALDARTGAEIWRYYTIKDAPRQTGVNSIGTPVYGPSGAAVWSSPAIDPVNGVLYLGSGNNYTQPASDHSDSLIALDLKTGQERWHNQLTPNDSWNLACNPEVYGLPAGAGPNCPSPSGLDYDVSSSPNLFVAPDPQHAGRLRLLVGAGQKSGIYHALDARTGQVVWQRQLSVGNAGGQAGILWGTSWDGQRLYVGTYQAKPGSLSALDPATGQVLWNTPSPADGCTTGGAVGDPFCKQALGGDPTNIPGVVFQGSWDGKFRAQSAATGTTLWQYDTRQSVVGTNGLRGQGGSIAAAGASVTSNGMVYINSGYQPAPVPAAGMAGNVLLAFGLGADH